MKSTSDLGNYLNGKSHDSTQKVAVPKQLGKQKIYSVAKISLVVSWWKKERMVPKDVYFQRTISLNTYL